MPLRIVIGRFSCCALLASAAAAQPAPDDLFRQQVEPILREHCFKCHSHTAEKIKGGLMLDSRAGLLEGGDSGPAIIPGAPEKSLLIEAVGYANDDLQMPPKKKLSPAEIATLSAWVKAGAAWPDDAAPVRATRPRGGTFTAEDRQWWSFQPLSRVQPPSAGDATGNGVDRFIRARLAAEGLAPAPKADKAVLLRRVYFDLVGLPPSQAEIESFLADTSPDAYRRVVDRLLASPHFGERQAMKWLDLVRYAETDGYKADDYRPHAWRYRDYVIDAFNTDKPYDRFVQEQLAGDELWPDEPAARVATGFLAHWIYEYNQRDAVGQRATILNDITDTTADVFLGLGLQCARCHDHKFDPILQKDYFRLQAFFAPVQHHNELPIASPAEREKYQARLAAWEAKTADLRRELEQLDAPFREKARVDAFNKFPPETRALFDKPVADRTPYERLITDLLWLQVDYAWEEKRFGGTVKEPAKSKRSALLAELKKFDADKPEPLRACLAATDIGPQSPPVTIPKKPALGEIAPGFLSILAPGDAAIAPAGAATTGRRTALAKWITSPENPLTARVVVNGIWQSYFGRGLASTTSDFGRLGEKPTHPELLDWLARQLIDGGWSLKALHRLLVLSETYQQAATHPLAAAAEQKDPANRLLWRGPRRRLEAEELRDAVLAVTGELKHVRGGPGAELEVPVRTIFQKVRRNRRDPLLEAFDQPERFTSTPDRNVTTSPTQALLLFNGKWAQQRAAAFASALKRAHGDDERAALADAFSRAYQRRATEAELREARAFLAEQTARIAAKEPPEEGLPFVAEKMRFRDGTAAALGEGTPQDRLVVPGAPAPKGGEFTIEAFISLKSVHAGEGLRTIVSHGAPGRPGWALAVTGKRSHLPQTLVLKLFDPSKPGASAEETVFSGLHIEQDVPFFVGVAVRLDDPTERGITFYAKDLTDSDDPLRTAQVLHRVSPGLRTQAPLVIGATPVGDQFFEGLIDDVRLSDAQLGPEELLLANASVRQHTMGYWKFEAAGPFRDSSERGLDVSVARGRPRPSNARSEAWVDFCHVLLNSNEFLHLE